ncbi:MAG: LysM peptidoglycan-binding domain-containing protein, partial [Limnohabitans sp.]|nr:LysM peptidoglycan-binding domain-containing protein [Limnohabitans sp.]
MSESTYPARIADQGGLLGLSQSFLMRFLMALASQSHRSSRSTGSYRQPSILFRPVTIMAFGAVVSLTGGYMMLRADADDGEGLSETSARVELHNTVPSMRATAQLATAEFPVTEPQPAALDQMVASAARRSNELNAVAEQTPATKPIDSPAQAEPQSSPTATPTATPATTPATPPTVRNGIDPNAKPANTAATAATGTPEAELALGLSLAASEPVKARQHLSNALLADTLGPLDARRASEALIELGRTLVFTPVYNANDPMFFQYTVAPNDTLEKIVRRHKIGCDWRLVQRINNIKKPEAIRVGQRLKLPKGPFSAVVSKRDYRVDICMGAGTDRVVLTSLPCGLGSANGTPTGSFKVRVGSKLLNPEWIHPVTGEHFAADDPKNPIGEHWLGLEGTDATNAQLAGYGIHGTIDVDSIGQDRSLGCVRLLADDIAVVWECLG